jgi:hypothetical protein
VVGERGVYFILPPRTIPDFRWPGGTRRYGPSTPDRIAYIGIPALSGETWPLAWVARPTPEHPFVDPCALHSALLAGAGCPTEL